MWSWPLVLEESTLYDLITEHKRSADIRYEAHSVIHLEDKPQNIGLPTCGDFLSITANTTIVVFWKGVVKKENIYYSCFLFRSAFLHST